ncbi:MAG: IS1595 family transposase, partial [Actinomycetota bacterium]
MHSYGNYPLDAGTCVCYIDGMSKVNRNEPKRGSASESRYSIFEFDKEFPDDAACLDYLVARFYPEGIFCPKCAKVTSHYRVKARPAYSCQFCGHYEYPMVGTIFEGSATSLRLWFYAMYLMASTRCGISAKQMERELGVTYKTAHRMMKRIRTELMTDEGDEPLSGDVEVDETGVHGRKRTKGTRSEGARWREAQPSVLGMVERGGRVRVRVIPSRRGEPLSSEVRANVNPA